MIPLDTRTVLFSGVITTLICALVIFFLWRRNRNQYAGIDLWALYFVLQSLAVILMAFRGMISEFLSIVVANALIIGGLVIMIRGLQRFIGKVAPILHLFVLSLVFVGIHAYFTIVQPDLHFRSINFSIGLVIMFFQAGWTALTHDEESLRQDLRPFALVCFLFVVINLLRTLFEILTPSHGDFMLAGSTQGFAILMYQMLYINFTFTLTLLVNRRLVASLKVDIEKRTALEDTLAESESHFRTLANSGQALIWTSDVDTLCKYFNEPWLQFTGRTYEQEYGAGWAEGVHPDDLERCVGTYLAAFEKREKFSMDYRIRRHDGEYRWVQDDGTPRFNSKGEFIGYIGHCLDITDRKRSEEIIRDQFIMLMGIVENIPNPIFSLDKGYRYTSFNSMHASIMKKVFNVDIDRGMCILDCITNPEDVVTVRANLDAALSGQAVVQEVYSGEDLFSRRFFEVNYRPIRSDEEGVEGIVVIINDFTERKRTEETLLLHADQLRYQHDVDQAILSGRASREGIIELTIQYLHRLLNATVVSIVLEEQGGAGVREYSLDGPEGPVLNRAWSDSSTFFQAIGSLVAGRIEDQSTAAPELRVMVERLFQEGTVPSGFLISPLHGGDALLGFLSIHWKTEQERHVEEKEIVEAAAGQISIALEQLRLREESRRNAKELEHRVHVRTLELQSANQELESFSYSVSHDLRSPLRSLDGFSQILIEEHGAHLDAEAQHLCHVIRLSAQKMSRLIDALLEFSRLGRSALQMSQIDMNALIQSVIAEVASEDERSRVEFRVGDLCNLRADRTLLRQVVTNLMQNALKFSTEQDHPIITVSCRSSASECILSIADNGVGFDMKYADKLFGVFQRLHSGSEYPGTGVGLAIVQRIIHRHGGRVWAESELGKGATFSFSLPRE